MAYASADTIFALSTAPGRGAIAVVRVSGSHSAAAVQRLTGLEPGPPRKAELRKFRRVSADSLVDSGLVIWFPSPCSYTGEDVAEFQVHGGRAVVAALVSGLSEIDGVRPAEPGEFTRRAFEGGRLDLTAAEGIADLIAADTEAQRRQALRQSGGGLAALYENWRGRLIEAMASAEAEIDFADQNLPESLIVQCKPQMAALAQEIRAHLADNRRGERLREGFYVAIIGPPNAGKSSLLNRVAGREAAIVSATAGTTRDVIEVHLDLEGWPVILADTAGLRQSLNEVESEGVQRALARAASADLRIALFDAARLPQIDDTTANLVDDDTLVVLNKSDLLNGDDVPHIVGREALAVSCRTGFGVERLVEQLGSAIVERFVAGDAPVITRARHRRALEETVAAIDRFVEGTAEELAAEDLRLGARAVGRITGRVDVEDILDVVFRDFCIGK